METIRLRKFSKEIILSEQPGGEFLAKCPCSSFDAHVQVQLTAAQAHELAGERKRHIQDILPDVHHLLREMFVTGFTPAQLDLTFTGKVKSRSHYRDFGYVFSDETPGANPPTSGGKEATTSRN